MILICKQSDRDDREKDYKDDRDDRDRRDTNGDDRKGMLVFFTDSCTRTPTDVLHA